MVSPRPRPSLFDQKIAPRSLGSLEITQSISHCSTIFPPLCCGHCSGCDVHLWLLKNFSWNSFRELKITRNQRGKHMHTIHNWLTVTRLKAHECKFTFRKSEAEAKLQIDDLANFQLRSKNQKKFHRVNHKAAKIMRKQIYFILIPNSFLLLSSFCWFFSPLIFHEASAPGSVSVCKPHNETRHKSISSAALALAWSADEWNESDT